MGLGRGAHCPAEELRLERVAEGRGGSAQSAQKTQEYEQAREKDLRRELRRRWQAKVKQDLVVAPLSKPFKQHSRATG